ncbi:lantibiotic dehydratase [Streptomyces sp. NPDC094143]|uniref:lantibiotic dehydratase n=1 Tax=Streptomyces sp. NPDC094143 TaxID=3155310 RepID=UPI00332F22FB
MYHAVDAGMIRTSVFPLEAPLPSPPVTADGTADIDTCRQWIEAVWADHNRAGAIELAAPVLAAGVTRALAGKATRSQVIRTTASLTRYLLRMQYRATPFGLFAGPAPLRIDDRAHARFGPDHRAFATADAVWLHDIFTRLESDVDVLRCLRVVVNPSCTLRGSRIQIKPQPGPEAPTETTLRRTPAVEKVLALAQSPTTVGDIVDKVQAEYPDTPPEKITTMVGDLVRHRVLLSSLHAPMTSTDPLGHLLAELDVTGATAPVPTVATLRSIHQTLSRHNQAAPAEQRPLRAQATAAMNELTGTAERSLAVNIRPHCDVVLPRAVAREAAAALDALTRLTPFPHGTPAWTDYLRRFLERYSMGTVVPLRDLTDPDTGLGFPVGYRGTVLKRPVLATTPRDEHLLTLAQNAALNRQLEIDLTEEDIQALTVGEPTQVPAHVELCFTVLAQTLEDLDEGRFTLSVAGLSLAAGTTAGRFLTALDPADQARMAAIYAALPTLTEGAARAQVSGPPLKIPTYNVSRVPAVVPDVLPVGEYNPNASLNSDDLGVVADSARLYLVTLSTGQLIEPSVMNAVELSNATHPMARFVSELHRSHSAALLPFHWGAASRLPFLPEVRVGRTILSPARWRLRQGDLADGPDWTKSLFAWRIRYGVPATVALGSDDRLLRLNLEEPAHRYLLRTDLRRHGTVVVQEAPADDLLGWAGRAHEVTLAFASDQPMATPGCRPAAIYSRDTARLPGATARPYVKLYGNPDRAAEVLTNHLPHLLLKLRGAPEAWFIRYADPDDHLRLRFHLPSTETFGEAAEHVAAWAADLRREGLLQRVQWDTDEPETGRYGSGALLDAAERYFAADSAAAIAQLTLPLKDHARPAITAASMVDIATTFLGSPAACWSWLKDHLLKAEGEPCPRDVQALAVRLTAPHADAAALREVPGSKALSGLWALRRQHLVDYRQALEAAGQDPRSVLPSLLHMHHNRAAGIDPDAEATCRRLARAAALSWTTRAEGAPR